MLLQQLTGHAGWPRDDAHTHKEVPHEYRTRSRTIRKGIDTSAVVLYLLAEDENTAQTVLTAPSRQVKAVTVESVGQPDAGDSSYIMYRTICQTWRTSLYRYLLKGSRKDVDCTVWTSRLGAPSATHRTRRPTLRLRTYSQIANRYAIDETPRILKGN